MNDNEPELLVDLHTEADLREGCVTIGGQLCFLLVEPSLSSGEVVSFIITPVMCIVMKSGLKQKESKNPLLASLVFITGIIITNSTRHCCFQP